MEFAGNGQAATGNGVAAPFLNTLSRHLNASGGEICLPLAPHAYWNGDSLTPDMLNEMMHIQLTSP